MAITTQVLGTLRGESYMFKPVSGTRYYLPKGKYQMLLVKDPNGSGSYGYKASNGATGGYSGAGFSTEFPTTSGETSWIEWVEITGPIWKALIAPYTTYGAIPPTTPT